VLFIAWLNARSNTFNQECIMSHISANDLKTKGVAAIEAMLAQHSEAIVSVRGKDRFVVMEIAQYNYLRECELEAALAETRADLAAGRFVQESAEAHLARLEKLA
jgi:PHD/YefM family antitoxin component YafN of YafNO toxin-antitoxin module